MGSREAKGRSLHDGDDRCAAHNRSALKQVCVGALEGGIGAALIPSANASPIHRSTAKRQVENDCRPAGGPHGTVMDCSGSHLTMSSNGSCHGFFSCRMQQREQRLGHE